MIRLSGHLGWKITDERTPYIHPLPVLSEAEERLINHAAEVAKNRREENEKDMKKIARDIVIQASRSLGVFIDDEQLSYLSRYLYLHVYGYCFLDDLLDDEEIEEISVVGINKPTYVFVRKKGWMEVNALFTSEKRMMEVINKAGAKIGRRITFQHPRLNAVLPDGSRLHASLPPISDGEITIRKFKRALFSPKMLCEGGVADYKSLALLSLLMQADVSIIIAGNTASGKTTTLNALFSFVPLSERVVMVEETPEIVIPHEHLVRMIPNEDMGITLRNLVYDTLRMRPDRMLVGEVRSPEEVEALFECILGGQSKGTYATIHGKSASETIKRLKRMGISEVDIESIDVIVVQRRYTAYDLKQRKLQEHRKITEIMDVKNKQSAMKSDELIDMISSSLNITKKEVRAELKKRETTIKQLNPSFNEFLFGFQSKFFNISEGKV